MHILISNDDGYSSVGLEMLVKYLQNFYDLTVVAPESNHSGASNSLTLDRPLTVNVMSNGFMVINGTPSDCVHMALTGLMSSLPDLFIAGINNGANMGDDTLYSGTVAAASEAYLFGIPAIAFSLVNRGWENIDSAVHVASKIINNQFYHPLAAPTLLNVNIPNLQFENLNGFKITRLGKRHPSQPVIRSTTPYGETVYWIGKVGTVSDSTNGTDFHAISTGMVSITPLSLDLTEYNQLDKLYKWVRYI